ncbi:MAG TPA: glutaredoxin family protein [Actinomycetes bacterium]|jgi:hypothetical protein|nr:glutaredoxin family protein [Actinomycetes bacterium]
MSTIQILLLTQTACRLCEQANQVLKRLAGEYDLAVTVVDLNTPGGRELAKAGLPFPPGVFLNDQLFSYGRLSERKLRRALDRRLVADAGSAPP